MLNINLWKVTLANASYSIFYLVTVANTRDANGNEKKVAR